MSLPPGARLGPYEIVSRLGAGGMGVVYRAHDSHLLRTVALKVLNKNVAGTADLLLEEARAASALNHPGICTVHEVREEGDRAFIVMEYVDGKPLSELVPVDGLSTDSLLRYALQIADALAHAHDHGVLHRDLKSTNVIVVKDGRAKIVDFGLAKRFAQAANDEATRSNISSDANRVAGTLAYMAPEVLLGDQPSALSDLWSFGVLLHEMSTGHLPFSGRSMFDETAAILRAPPSPLPTRLPAGIRMIIARCLAKEPSQRYQSAREVRAALEAVDSNVAIEPVPPQTVPKGWRIDWRIVAAVVGIAFAVIIAGWWFVRWPSPRPADRLIHVLSSDREIADPALSPDGTMIAYVAEDENGQIDLFTSRVAGGSRVRLTSDSAREGRPRFSPDGERIVFARRLLEGAAPEIGIVPSLGGQLSIVVSTGSQPAWAPDGQRLAFVRWADGGKSYALATAGADGSNVRDLVWSTAAAPSIRAPSWSPDGRLIAFVRGSGGVAGEIWLTNADASGAPRRMTADPASIFSDEPVFAPDGRVIIHSSNRGGATNLWSLPLAGGAAIRLTSGPGPDGSPTVDARGRIAFVNTRWRNELIVQNLATSEKRSLLRHTPFLWAPSFAPLSQELAFSRSEVDGSWHIWTTSFDGRTVRQLTDTDRGEIYPRWTADGGSVLFHNWETPRRVWRVPRDGGPPVPLTSASDDASYGDLSLDGQTLAFVISDRSNEHVYLLSLAPGSRPRLLRRDASLPRWSPDGQWIAFAPNRGYFSGVFIVRPDGTGERQLVTTGGWPVWWPDGQRIGYLTIRPDAAQEIRAVSVSTGAVSDPIPFRFAGNNEPFDLSREWLATTDSVHVSSEVWVLEHRP